MGGGVQAGGVPGWPERAGGGSHQQGGLLSSKIDSQAPASSEQQVVWPNLSVAHLTSIGE